MSEQKRAMNPLRASPPMLHAEAGSFTMSQSACDTHCGCGVSIHSCARVPKAVPRRHIKKSKCLINRTIYNFGKYKHNLRLPQKSRDIGLIRTSHRCTTLKKSGGRGIKKVRGHRLTPPTPDHPLTRFVAFRSQASCSRSLCATHRHRGQPVSPHARHTRTNVPARRPLRRVRHAGLRRR